MIEMSIFETDLDSQMKDFIKRFKIGHRAVILIFSGNYIDIVELDENGLEYYGEGIQDEATVYDIKKYFEDANIPYKIERDDWNEEH